MGGIGWRCTGCLRVYQQADRAAYHDGRLYCIGCAPKDAAVECPRPGCGVLDCDEHCPRCGEDDCGGHDEPEDPTAWNPRKFA